MDSTLLRAKVSDYNCKFQDPEAVLATFREEWQRELEGVQVQKGLCNVSMQSSPSKEATQGSSNHTKGSLNALQSAPKNTDSDSGGGIISEGGEGGNDGYGDPDVDSSTQMEEVTPDVETKVGSVGFFLLNILH